ncbi:MAG: phosphatase PAP2 family protein [Myxococcota bacterium]|nr:phosphatase PAP2 family protein [Myxococcota bacterium]
MLRETLALALLALLAAAIWGFVELTDEVLEGETRAFDRRLLLALRDPGDPAQPIGPDWLQEMGRDFTALGGVGVLSLLVGSTAAFEWTRGRRGNALLVLGAAAGALLISQGLKGAFGRPRPDLVPHGSYVYTSSFPSGHSMLSAAVYLSLAGLLARAQPRKREKGFLIGLALLITGLVGTSRVYLGVHWPTDVLAGWCAGAAWAVACQLAAVRLLDGGPSPPPA